MAWEEDVTKRIKSINARITTVQRLYGGDSDIYKRIVSTVKRAGGEKGRFRKSMFLGSLRDLSRAERALITIENSKYLTKAGRAQIGEEARRTFVVHNADMSSETLTRMYDIFQNSGVLGRLFEIYSSDVIVDSIMNALEREKSDENYIDYVKGSIEYIATHMGDYNTTEAVVNAFEELLK